MQIVHIRCDRCGKDIACGGDSTRRNFHWARCSVNLHIFDFCPACWKEILALANVAEPVED